MVALCLTATDSKYRTLTATTHCLKGPDVFPSRGARCTMAIDKTSDFNFKAFGLALMGILFPSPVRFIHKTLW